MSFIKSIKLKNFRNFKALEINNFERFNILVGNNAVGKTNLLEAINLICEQHSFRKPKWQDLLTSSAVNNDLMFIEGIDSENNKISLSVSNGSKKLKFNGKYKTSIDIKNKLPCVTFIPDDLMVVKGSSKLRRDLVDKIGCQLSKNYQVVRRDYNNLIAQKNYMLKKCPDLNTLKALNEVMVITASQFTLLRRNLLSIYAEYITNSYNKICSSHDEDNLNKSNEALNFYYVSNILNFDKESFENVTECNLTKAELQKLIKDKLLLLEQKELVSGRSLIGPHRDDIKFTLNNIEAKDYASQGQHRSIILALKLAHLKLIESKIKKSPILLLDDVMSELDKTRRNKLLNLLNNISQVFITTTNLDYFDNSFLDKADIIKLP